MHDWQFTKFNAFVLGAWLTSIAYLWVGDQIIIRKNEIIQNRDSIITNQKIVIDSLANKISPSDTTSKTIVPILK